MMAAYSRTPPRSEWDEERHQEKGSSADSEVPQWSHSGNQKTAGSVSDDSCQDATSYSLQTTGPAAVLLHSDLASEQAFLLQLIDNERSLQGTAPASDHGREHADQMPLYYSPYGLAPDGLCSDSLGLYHPGPTLRDNCGKRGSQFVGHSPQMRPSPPVFMSVHACGGSSPESARFPVLESECCSHAGRSDCPCASSSPSSRASMDGRIEETSNCPCSCSSVRSSPVLLPPGYHSAVPPTSYPGGPLYVDPRDTLAIDCASTGRSRHPEGSGELRSGFHGSLAWSACSAVSVPARSKGVPEYPSYPYSLSYPENQEELGGQDVNRAGIDDQTTAATAAGAPCLASPCCNDKRVQSPGDRAPALMDQALQSPSQQRAPVSDAGPQIPPGGEAALLTHTIEHKRDQVRLPVSRPLEQVHAGGEERVSEQGQDICDRKPDRGWERRYSPCVNASRAPQAPTRDATEDRETGCGSADRAASFSVDERRGDAGAFAEGELRRGQEYTALSDPREGGSQIQRTTEEDLVYLQNMVSVATSIVMTRKNKRLTPDDFVLLKVIGKGSYGKVMLVQFKQDGRVYAMKMLRKEAVIRRNQVEHTRTERDVLAWVSHPFIVQLHYAFQTRKKLYFVLEYCPGGELFFHLSRAGRFTECRVRFYSAEVLLALEHLHSYNIVYRDLKPENVLLDDQGHVRLTDFGLSKEGVEDNVSARSLCGTPEYLAPEILNQRGHGKAVDWWSLGALIYEMLTGLPPFYSGDRERLFENIRSSELQYPTYMSAVAVDLLKRLLQRDPDKRLGGGPLDAEEIKTHPFYASVDWSALRRKQVRPPFRPRLQSATDVQYFDKEFVKLPVINSEVHESPIGVAAGSQEEQVHGHRDAGHTVGFSSPSAGSGYQKHAGFGGEQTLCVSPTVASLLPSRGCCFPPSSHGSAAAERASPLTANESNSSATGRIPAELQADGAGSADSGLKPGGGDPGSYLREVEDHAAADTLAAHIGLVSYGASGGDGMPTRQDNSPEGQTAFESHLVPHPPFDDDSDDSLFEGFTYDERTDNTLGEAAGVAGSYPGADEVD
ncbi:agc kinase [Cystoisospora suis]|uniref:non-specific serine/threonine protein kinase n=1 Tax=Cystoisospora suis TaxID=483139 RepID=A0A2C6LDG4_9APIC|nr:agc kinase [Cystoisospora suis]